jgi:hypothetical protein
MQGILARIFAAGQQGSVALRPSSSVVCSGGRGEIGAHYSGRQGLAKYYSRKAGFFQRHVGSCFCSMTGISPDELRSVAGLQEICRHALKK